MPPCSGAFDSSRRRSFTYRFRELLLIDHQVVGPVEHELDLLFQFLAGLRDTRGVVRLRAARHLVQSSRRTRPRDRISRCRVRRRLACRNAVAQSIGVHF